MTKVTEDQFHWEGDRLIHRPTGATFSLNSEWVNFGRAGETLDDSTSYEREDVADVASRMVFAERECRKAGPS
ncbi:hypothetical protein [Leisingera sp. ANG59]|uniref:hypothetical protein n=1 Tax=Leisingera sp. ANG59 TaxID=2675221 RepID=UPI0015742862|nr:hypothetical protein [Leisingera sp. ANG59]NSY41533.1 hypothetical protein [Leisingera sp. ANG59]